MKARPTQFSLLSLVIFLFIFMSLPAMAEDFGKSQELVAKGTAVFKSFMKDPNMEWFRNNVHRARGVFIVPQMLRGGFIIGGSGGSGMLVARDNKTNEWSYPAFYTMGSVSFGLQIGADASEIILMIMTEKGINAMLTTEFKLGGDVSVAAGPIGGSAKAQTADILAFGRSKGLFGGISIEGAVVAPRYDWNDNYYKGPASPVDILIKRTVKNPQADELRAILPKQQVSRTKPLGT
jgi:lipid-binding SYLF domain-containing protein